MEISRCFAAICSAVARRFGPFAAGAAGSTGRSSAVSGSGGADGLRATAFGGGRADRRGAGAGSTETSSNCFTALPAGFPFPFLVASAFRAIGL
jgi:hypothetical protein